MRLIEDLIEDVKTQLPVYKGIVATVSELPSTGQTTGDVYIVYEDENFYIWNGMEWEMFIRLNEKGNPDIIFCKDCKYWNKIDKAMYCTRHISIMYMDADDFCSRGERK